MLQVAAQMNKHYLLKIIVTKRFLKLVLSSLTKNIFKLNARQNLTRTINYPKAKIILKSKTKTLLLIEHILAWRESCLPANCLNNETPRDTPI